MIVVSRYRVPVQDAEDFRDQALLALHALTARPGCRDGRVGRAIDDPALWTLATTWDSVGSYRRALSSYDVKLYAVPLMYRALDEPTAFEDLVSWQAGGQLTTHDSALAADAERVNLGEAATPAAPLDLPPTLPPPPIS